MRTRNPSYRRARDITEGRVAARRAGGNLRIVDGAGTDIIISTLRLEGATVTEIDDSEALIAVGSTGAFVPDATIVGVKDSGNPTFNFDFIPENITLVGSTYYCSGQVNWASGTKSAGLATATDRDGPWTVYGSNPILTPGSQAWESAISNLGLNAPEIRFVDPTYYLYYSAEDFTAGSYGAIGVASSTAITGTYTKYASNPILTPGTAGTWDSRRVAEPSMWEHAGTYYMLYMGETTSASWGASEKVGGATAPHPLGPWTKLAGNPIITHGADGAWDDDLVADPYLFRIGSRWWCLYSGGGSDGGTGTRKWHLGLAYADTFDGTWTKYEGNPILTASGSGFDEMAAWRGSIYIEGSTYSGVYGGLNSDLSAVKGGNFTITLTGGGAVQVTPEAADIVITDAGGYYTGTEVETALQELGADVASLQAGQLGGHWETIVAGSAPPVAVTNEAADDWLVGFVTD